MVLCVRHRAGLPCRPALQRRVPEPLSCHKRSVRANVAQAEPSCAEAAPDQEPSSLQQPSSATTGCSFLKTLTIENFALVSNANIQFQPGLNVISGASGSGKSVLLQALAVVLGAAVDKDMVHDQEDKAGSLLAHPICSDCSESARLLHLLFQILSLQDPNAACKQPVVSKT